MDYKHHPSYNEDPVPIPEANSGLKKGQSNEYMVCWVYCKTYNALFRIVLDQP